MAGTAILKVDIIGDATKALKAMGQVEDKATGSKSKFSSLGKVVGGALGTAAVIGFGKATISAANESAKSTARLDQVFSSMGDTTGKASKAAQDYADTLSKKIGVDDDTIMSAQAQLATFGKVSDETARATGIFDRATTAAADLAAAGFGSLDTNSIQLGKALQDPVKGIAALAKSGVTFTAAQKEQIKAMAGSAMSAEKQAKAQEGLKKAQVASFGAVVKLNEKQTAYNEAVRKYGPSSKEAAKAAKDVAKAQEGVAKAGDKVTEAQGKVAASTKHGTDLLGAQKLVLKAVETQVGGTAAATATESEKMAVAWGETQESIGKALVPVLEKLLPILQQVATWIQNNTQYVIPLAIAFGVLAVAWNVAALAVTLLGVSMATAFIWVLAIMAAIAAVIAIGILLAKNWDKIKEVASKVWQSILNVIRGVWDWIKANWPLLLAILTGPFGMAVLVIVRNWDTIKSAINSVWTWIKSTMGLVYGVLTTPFRVAADVIKNIWEGIKTSISGVWTWITDKFSALGDIASRAVSALRAPFNAFIRAWNSITFRIPRIDIPKIHIPGTDKDIGGGSFGGQSFGVPHIPELATGGEVLRTGLAIVHRGETFSGVGRTLNGDNTTNVNITVNATGLGAQAPDIQRAVVDALRIYTSRNGPLGAPIVAA